jgi:molybdopterin-binding protein
MNQALRLADSVVRLERGKTVDIDITNILEGVIGEKDGEAVMDAGGKTPLYLVTHCRGRGRIAISPRDIVVSKTPIDSSMRNRFEGTVTAIQSRNGSIELTIDIGMELKAIITKSSLQRLNITVDSPIYVSFKATAIKVLSSGI